MSISRRNILKSLAATSTLAITGCSVKSEAMIDKKINTKHPNLLIILPDEMRLFALEFMKEDPSITPNLNKFQKESCFFRQNVSNFPLCTPFRGMLMTGQYPYRNGLQGNSHTGTPNQFGGRDFGIYLKKEALTWSDLLKEQGYSLGYIGKWHLDAPKPPFIPSYNNPLGGRYWNDWTAPDERHGFDYWYSYGTNDLHLTPMYWTNDTPRNKPLHINQWSPEHEADRAIEYLRNKDGKYRDNNQPFALVVSMNPPHSPYDQVPQKYLDKITKTSEELNTRPNVDWNAKYPQGYGPQYFKQYMAMINGVDEQFGRIINELDSLDLAENTLVMFFSDHGTCMGSHAEPSKNVGFEEAMRTPMMFRWKNHIKPKIDDILFSAPDIFPTMLSLMGFNNIIPDRVEGTGVFQDSCH